MQPSEPKDVTRRKFLTTAGSGLAAAGLAGGSALAVPPAVIDLAPPDRQPPQLPLPGGPQKKLGYAIVGLGELALGEVLPAFGQSQRCTPVALVSGHADKARKVASHYGIDAKNIYDYDSYDKIKDNPAIDVVYIILPNSMHAEYTIRAFEAGKHVLCEKPMAVTPAECERMIAAGKKADRKLMIAYRLHYEPFNKKMIEIARKGEYGPIRLISADNVQNVKAPNIRLSKKTGGGPLGDVGIYCLNACRYLTGEEPTAVSGMLFQPKDDPRFAEVPDRVAFQLMFPSGAIANCTAGFSTATVRRYQVFCQDGWYGLDPAYSYQNLEAHVGTAKGREKLEIMPVNHFAAEMDDFAKCIMTGKESATPGEEGLRDMRIIARIEQAAAEGKRLDV